MSPLPNTISPLLYEVLFPTGATQVRIVVDLVDDNWYDPDETLVLELVGLHEYDAPRSALPASVVRLDPDRQVAVGYIADDEPEPHLFLHNFAASCESTEGDPAGAGSFVVRLLDPNDTTAFARSAATVTVDLRTEDIDAVAGVDYTALPARTLTFNPGVTQQPGTALTVQTTDDSLSPEAEADETFKVLIENPSGAPLGAITEATCTIIDNEATLTVEDASVEEGDLTATPPNPGDPLTFEFALDKAITAPVVFRYELEDIDLSLGLPQARRSLGATCTAGDDYLEDSGTITINPHPTPGQVPDPVDLDVTICDDDLAEPDEAFWLKVEWDSGEAVVENDGGARGPSKTTTHSRSSWPTPTKSKASCWSSRWAWRCGAARRTSHRRSTSATPSQRTPRRRPSKASTTKPPPVRPPPR